MKRGDLVKLKNGCTYRVAGMTEQLDGRKMILLEDVDSKALTIVYHDELADLLAT